MTQLNQIYKCNICGNMTEVIHTGQGELVCCGQPMELLQTQTQDAELGEKHVPVTEKLPATVCEEQTGVKVKIGSSLHPMTTEHQIEWIEIITADGRVGRKYLQLQDAPEINFTTKSEVINARTYCNLHGLWQS
ncbi:MAG: desulfoferrodoxin [Patescibacteria group bacterium]|jgi:superoxide reductase|nr:desulfoferrodoxin [Patescibacteria group bacterium]